MQEAYITRAQQTSTGKEADLPRSCFSTPRLCLKGLLCVFASTPLELDAFHLDGALLFPPVLASSAPAGTDARPDEAAIFVSLRSGSGGGLKRVGEGSSTVAAEAFPEGFASSKGVPPLSSSAKEPLVRVDPRDEGTEGSLPFRKDAEDVAVSASGTGEA
jgi:hypothetical protein